MERDAMRQQVIEALRLSGVEAPSHTRDDAEVTPLVLNPSANRRSSFVNKVQPRGVGAPNLLLPGAASTPASVGSGLA